MKRILDVVLSVAGLLLLSPLFLLAAVMVRLDGEGAVLFRQQRVGRHGHPFTILKFRTMRQPAADAARAGGALVTAETDSRITRWGRLLRRTKLDELPQLFNVLAGQMSLVGPRPEIPHYVDLWSERDRELILSVRPGITDFASIMFRDEDRLLAGQADPQDYYRRCLVPRKLRLGRFYVRKAGLGADMWLLLQTIRAVLGLSARPSREPPRRPAAGGGESWLRNDAPYWGGLLMVAALSYLDVQLATWGLAATVVLVLAARPRQALGMAAFLLGFKQIFSLDPDHTKFAMVAALAVIAVQSVADRRTWAIIRRLHHHPLLALLAASAVLNAAHVLLSPDREGAFRLGWHLLATLAGLRAAALAGDAGAMRSLRHSVVAAGVGIVIVSAAYLYFPWPELIGGGFVHTEVLRLVGVQDDSNSVARWFLPAALAALVFHDRSRSRWGWAMIAGATIVLCAAASKSGLIWFAVALLAVPLLSGRWRAAGRSLVAVSVGAALWFGAIEHPLKHYGATWWYEAKLSKDAAVLVAYDLYVRQDSIYKKMSKYAPKGLFGDMLVSLRIRTSTTPMVVDAKPSGVAADGQKNFNAARDWSRIRDARADTAPPAQARALAQPQPAGGVALLESGNRRRLWGAGMEVVREHFWWGIGAMGWQQEFSRRLGFPYASPHNGFLHVAGSYGVLGALLYLAALGRVLWLLVKRRGEIWTLGVVACIFAFETFDVSSIFTPTIIGAVACMLIGALEGADASARRAPAEGVGS